MSDLETRLTEALRAEVGGGAGRDRPGRRRAGAGPGARRRTRIAGGAAVAQPSAVPGVCACR